MPEIYDNPEAAPQNKVAIYDKPAAPSLVGIHDEDLDLGHQLHVYDALTWGRDQTVIKQISKSATEHGAGKGGVSGGSESGNSGLNYGAASNSGDNTGLNSSGDTATTGTPTDTGVGTRRSNSAGTESDSAMERKQ